MGLLDGFLGKKKESSSSPVLPASATLGAATPGKSDGMAEVVQVLSMRGMTVAGVQIKSGSIRLNSTTLINGKTATVKSIESQREQLVEAVPGDRALLSLFGVQKSDLSPGMQLFFVWPK